MRRLQMPSEPDTSNYPNGSTQTVRTTDGARSDRTLVGAQDPEAQPEGRIGDHEGSRAKKHLGPLARSIPDGAANNCAVMSQEIGDSFVSGHR